MLLLCVGSRGNENIYWSSQVIRKCISAIAILTSTGHLLLGQVAPSTLQIVSRFVSPGASLVEFIEADPSTGQTIKRSIAVLEASLSNGKRNIAFAESTRLNDKGDSILSINVLQAEADAYRIVFSKTYFDRVLFAQAFKTIGLQVVKLSDSKNGLLVITSPGASLGGDLEIFAWEDGLGLVNVAPSNVGSAYQFALSNSGGKLQVDISYTKGKRGTDSPPKTVLQWDGEKQAMIAVGK